MANVFISYSRRDKDFVCRLHAGLTDRNISTWIDWDIPASWEWMTEINTEIRAADAFVFVISPDSINSNICMKELEQARALRKRLIPIVCREVPTTQIPASLSQLNLIFFVQDEEFSAAIEMLVHAVDIKPPTRLERFVLLLLSYSGMPGIQVGEKFRNYHVVLSVLFSFILCIQLLLTVWISEPILSSNPEGFLIPVVGVYLGLIGMNSRRWDKVAKIAVFVSVIIGILMVALSMFQY
jgi:hypothetical protein